MARGFRSSQFRGRGSQGMGEDVNPQAYIVNLADCMLVLACGFMVMLVARYNLNITNDVQVTEDQLEQIETDESDNDSSLEDGSSFIEAGTAYYDPETNTYYIKETTDEDGNTVTDSSSTSSSSSSSSSSASGSSSSSSSSSSSDKAIRDAKAAGAD